MFSVQRADEFLILFFHHLTHKHVGIRIYSRPFQVCTVCVNPLGSELPYISGTHSKSGGAEETKITTKNNQKIQKINETTIRNHLKSKAVVIRFLSPFIFIFLVCLSFLRFRFHHSLFILFPIFSVEGAWQCE